jgi:hypothetical protein
VGGDTTLKPRAKGKMIKEKIRHKDIWEIFEELITEEDDKEERRE